MTFSELQSYVRERITLSGSDSDRVSQITRMLRAEHIKLVQEYRLLTAVGSITLTADTATASLPADWLETLTLNIGSTRCHLVTPEEMAEYEAMNATAIDDQSGPSIYYQVDEDTIYLYPTPDANGTGTIRYIKKPTAMSDEDDTPEGVPSGHEQLLAEIVVHRMALADEALQLASASMQLIGQMKNDLRNHINRRGSRGRTRLRLRGYGPR